MLYAVLSDIHSNFDALEAVLSFCLNSNVDGYIICGDIVGYGPEPDRCIEEIKKLKNLIVVAGNHDLAVCGVKEITWFHEDARKAILWTQNNIKSENKEFLIQLEKKVIKENFTVVHGSPRAPVDEYLIYTDELYENIKYFETQICFVGHSHVPFVFSFINETKDINSTNFQKDDFLKEKDPFFNFKLKPVINEEVLILNPKKKYIVNCGSVGQPRDGINKACFLIFNSETGELEYKRVEYNITDVQKKMSDVGLPKYLIERLEYGR